MTEGPIVCDAGPLIALTIVDRLKLLASLYPRVLVPEAVIREILDSGMDRAGARQIQSASWLEIVPTHGVEPLLAAELGAGESEVISDAVRLRTRLVLIDERRARRIAAQVYGLAVKGTGGLLVQALRHARGRGQLFGRQAHRRQRGAAPLVGRERGTATLPARCRPPLALSIRHCRHQLRHVSNPVPP